MAGYVESRNGCNGNGMVTGRQRERNEIVILNLKNTLKTLMRGE